MKNFNSQQDYPGCVDGEANILKKCDARRQVVSDNDMFSSLSKKWDRLDLCPDRHVRGLAHRWAGRCPDCCERGFAQWGADRCQQSWETPFLRWRKVKARRVNGRLLVSVDAGDGVINVMPNFWHELLVLWPSLLSSTARRNKTGNIEKEEERKEICLHPYPSIVFSYHVVLSTLFVPKLNKFSWVVSIALAG